MNKRRRWKAKARRLDFRRRHEDYSRLCESYGVRLVKKLTFRPGAFSWFSFGETDIVGPWWHA